MIEIISPSGKHLDVYEDVSLSLERTNPFWSEKGSSSLSFSIPVTDNNRRLLGLYGVSGSLFVPESKFSVVVKLDGIELLGLLILENVGESSYEVSLLFGESLFYYKIEGISMPDVFEGETCPVESLNDREEIIFMSALSVEYLNENNDYYKLTSDLAEVENTVNYSVDDTTVEALPRYRLGVHLKLKYVIRSLFKYFGFDVNLDKVERIAPLVLLNNVMDLCVKDEVEYKYMVPTSDVSDFLEAIRRTFLMEFYFDSYTNTFVAYPCESLSEDIIDFSTKLGSEVVSLFDQSKKISITQDHDELPEEYEEYIQMKDYKSIGKDVEDIDIGIHGLCVTLGTSSSELALSILPSVRWIYTEISYEEPSGGSNGGGGTPPPEGPSGGGGGSGSGGDDVYRCGNCGNAYDPAIGDFSQNIPPGTSFKDLPEGWCCPNCGAWKQEFIIPYSLSLYSDPVEESPVDVIDSTSEPDDMPIMVVYGDTRTPLPFTIYKTISHYPEYPYSGKTTFKHFGDNGFDLVLSPAFPLVCTSDKVYTQYKFKWDGYKNISDLYSYKQQQILKSCIVKVNLGMSISEFLNLKMYSIISILGLNYQLVSLKCKKTHSSISVVEAELRSLYY